MSLKRILVILLILGGASLSVWFFLHRPQNLPTKNPSLLKTRDSYRVQPIFSGKNSPQSSAAHHQGSAVWVGPYRLELALQGLNGSRAQYGVYLENSQGLPLTPRTSEILIKLPDNKLLKTKPLANGILVALGPLPELPVNLVVIGQINNKKFSAALIIKNLRQTKISRQFD